MSRKPRVHYPDAIYHVVVRGNNRARVFEDAAEKKKYLAILTHYKQRYDFQLFAYVIMDNHAHLIIQVKDIPLSKIMQCIQLRFTRYYNLKYLHTGHVFEQRYKAFLCDNETYLLTLLCYIHQNPLRTHIPEAYLYPWSSHQSYCQASSALVDYAFILDSLNSNRESAIYQYLSLVQAPLSNFQYKSNSVKPTPQTSSKVEKESQTTSWDELLSHIASDEKINTFQLSRKCRIHPVVAARRRLVYEALENKIMNHQQLADTLSLDPSRVSQLYYEFQASLLVNN